MQLPLVCMARDMYRAYLKCLTPGMVDHVIKIIIMVIIMQKSHRVTVQLFLIACTLTLIGTLLKRDTRQANQIRGVDHAAALQLPSIVMARRR